MGRGAAHSVCCLIFGYVSVPAKTDTFLDRLGNTLSNAGSGFLVFLEGLLFFLIYTVPYLA